MKEKKIKNFSELKLMTPEKSTLYDWNKVGWRDDGWGQILYAGWNSIPASQLCLQPNIKDLAYLVVPPA